MDAGYYIASAAAILLFSFCPHMSSSISFNHNQTQVQVHKSCAYLLTYTVTRSVMPNPYDSTATSQPLNFGYRTGGALSTSTCTSLS